MIRIVIINRGFNNYYLKQTVKFYKRRYGTLRIACMHNDCITECKRNRDRTKFKRMHSISMQYFDKIIHTIDHYAYKNESLDYMKNERGSHVNPLLSREEVNERNRKRWNM